MILYAQRKIGNIFSIVQENIVKYIGVRLRVLLEGGNRHLIW